MSIITTFNIGDSLTVTGSEDASYLYTLDYTNLVQLQDSLPTGLDLYLTYTSCDQAVRAEMFFNTDTETQAVFESHYIVDHSTDLADVQANLASARIEAPTITIYNTTDEVVRKSVNLKDVIAVNLIIYTPIPGTSFSLTLNAGDRTGTPVNGDAYPRWAVQNEKGQSRHRRMRVLGYI